MNIFALYTLQGLSGRRFVSVWDVDARELHQNRTPCLSSTRPKPTTSAQLHALATSVLCHPSVSKPCSRARSPQRMQRSPSRTSLHSAPSNNRSQSPSPSSSKPRKQADKVAVKNLDHQFDSELYQAARSPFIGPQNALPKHPTVLFSSCLSEMDAQLAALQGIADSLETDFSNTRMVCVFFFQCQSKGPKVVRGPKWYFSQCMQGQNF